MVSYRVNRKLSAYQTGSLMTAILAMPYFQSTFNISTEKPEDAKWISIIFSIYTV